MAEPKKPNPPPTSPPPASAAPASRVSAPSVDPMTAFRESLKVMTLQFASALPPQIPIERFVRVVLTAVQNDPSILEADRKSLWNACMRSASDGLYPDGREAALVVYKLKSGQKIVQYMPMVTGILKKVRNSGDLGTITSLLVFPEDKFEYWIDDEGEHVMHRPLLTGPREAPIGVYGMCKTKDGFFYFEFMTAGEINNIRESSRAKDGGPWSGKFEGEMWRKSVIRRLSKRLPMSTDIEELIRDDANLAIDTGKEAAQIPVTTSVMDMMAHSDAPPKEEQPAAEDEIAPAQEEPTATPEDLLRAEVLELAAEMEWDLTKLQRFVKDNFRKQMMELVLADLDKLANMLAEQSEFNKVKAAQPAEGEMK